MYCFNFTLYISPSFESPKLHGEGSSATQSTGAPKTRSQSQSRESGNQTLSSVHRAVIEKCETTLELYRKGHCNRASATLGFSKLVTGAGLPDESAAQTLQSYLGLLDNIDRENSAARSDRANQRSAEVSRGANTGGGNLGPSQSPGQVEQPPSSKRAQREEPSQSTDESDSDDK